MLMVTLIKVCFKMIKNMDTVYTISMKKLFIKVFTTWTKNKEREFNFIKMEIMKDYGRME